LAAARGRLMSAWFITTPAESSFPGQMRRFGVASGEIQYGLWPL
jgi:hypothetical protein